MKNILTEQFVYPKSVTSIDPVVEKIIDLDLGPIKFKLVHENGFDIAEVNKLEKQYKQFLMLIHLYPELSVVPTKSIDEIWHTHILDTEKYREDCDYIFGTFIDHFPYLGLRGEGDKILLTNSFEKTKELFIKEFGETVFDASRCEGTECGGTACGKSNCEKKVTIRPTLN